MLRSVSVISSDLACVLLAACASLLTAQQAPSVDDLSANGGAANPPSAYRFSSPSYSSSAWDQLFVDALRLGLRSASGNAGMNGGASYAGGADSFSSGGANLVPGSAAGMGDRPSFASGPHSGASDGRPDSAFTGGPGRSGAIGADSLFQMASDLSRGLAAGHSGAVGTALGLLPQFNQLLRGGLSVPVDSSYGRFRLSSPNLLRGSALPSASFTSSPVHSGRFDLSTSATVGGYGAGLGASSSGASSFNARQVAGSMSSFSSGSMAGSPGGGPGGGMGGGPHGGPGSGSGARPSASLSLHLSF